MKRSPAVKTVMTLFPITIEIDATLKKAAVVMAEHDIRNLPVIFEGKVVGVLSDRDMKLSAAVSGKPLEELLVRDAVPKEPYVVDLSTPLVEVLEHMAEEALDAALVMKSGKIAGIFTVVDACRAFAEHLRHAYSGSDEPDDDIA